MQKIFIYGYFAKGVVTIVRNWFAYVLFFFSINKSSTFDVILRNGLHITIRRGGGDMIAIFEDFYEGQYFPDKALPPKRIRTVLDIGAHIGTFSLLVHLLHKKATIYAYEPIRENFALLEKNIRANNTKRLFHLYHQAVWKNDNNQKIYFDGNSFLGSSLSNKKSSSHYEVVSCVTLQQIFKKERIPMCDLVKIDVEGAEYEILYTTPKSILARMKAIYVEFHGTIDDIAHKRKTLIDFFHKQGYFVYQYTKRDILYAVRQKSTIKVSPLLTACQ